MVDGGIIRWATTLMAAAAICTAGPAPAENAPIPCPVDAKLATLLAASDLVLMGRMNVPKQGLADEARRPSPKYLDIPIEVALVAKGESVGSATVRFYTQDSPYKPSNEAVLALAGEPALLFLTRGDYGAAGLNFAGYRPDALTRATDPGVVAVRAEVSRQTRIAASRPAGTMLPHFTEVRALIARLGRVSGNRQQRVFDQLEALGEAAVPAIIAQMDDRRSLRTQAISLVNHAPDAFEGMRHYGPEQVVDGLDAVLNQITGESFGSIMNGGSDRRRATTVAGWRVYAADLRCSR